MKQIKIKPTFLEGEGPTLNIDTTILSGHCQ